MTQVSSTTLRTMFYPASSSRWLARPLFPLFDLSSANSVGYPVVDSAPVLERRRDMTICACVKVRDAIILGTDSMTQVMSIGPGNQPMVAKSYANAHKLFRVGPL